MSNTAVSFAKPLFFIMDKLKLAKHVFGKKNCFWKYTKPQYTKIYQNKTTAKQSILISNLSITSFKMF